jgi:hypothetical protein
LTRQKPSKPKLNAGEVIGDIIDRFRRSIGWNLAQEQTEEEKKDRMQLIAVFLEILGAAAVPVEEYERCYRRATVTRARLKADGKSVPYHITAEELVTEWILLQRSRATQPESQDKPAELCSFRNNHIDGEPIVEYAFSGITDMILPCHECRPEAHRVRKNEKIEQHNATFASRRLEAGEPPEEKPINRCRKCDRPAEVDENFICADCKKPPQTSAEACKNCGEEPQGGGVRLSADFIVCQKCHEEIIKLRQSQ